MINDIDTIREHTQALNANTQAVSELIAQLKKPDIPPDKSVWDAERCAGYLGISKTRFLQTIAPLPGFPDSANFDTTTGRTHPKWIEQRVIDWALAHWDRQEARRRTRK